MITNKKLTSKIRSKETMKNGNENGKNYEVGKGKPPKEGQFTSERQPSPEAKSKGWDKRKAKLRVLDKMERIDTMSVKELIDIEKDIKLHPENYSVEFDTLVKYRLKEKFVTDWLDRKIGKPQQDIDLQGNVNLTVKDIVKELKELDNEPIN